MLKKLILIGLVGIFLTSVTQVFAQDVVFTSKGKKYHKASCRLIKKKSNLSTIDKELAIKKKLTPCKRCFKEDIIDDSQEVKQLQNEEGKEIAEFAGQG